MRVGVEVLRSWRGAASGGFARRRVALFGLGRSVAGQQEGFQHGERTRCAEGHGAGRNGASRDGLERFRPDWDRFRVRPFSSCPGVFGPPIAAPAGRGGPDKPGHDEVEGRSLVSSQRENALVGGCLGHGIRADSFRYGGVAAPPDRGPRTAPSLDGVGIGRCWVFRWPVRC
jgi:hypothetical protein